VNGEDRIVGYGLGGFDPSSVEEARQHRASRSGDLAVSRMRTLRKCGHMLFLVEATRVWSVCPPDYCRPQSRGGVWLSPSRNWEDGSMPRVQANAYQTPVWVPVRPWAGVDSDVRCNPVDSIDFSTESRVSIPNPAFCSVSTSEKEHRAPSDAGGCTSRRNSGGTVMNDSDLPIRSMAMDRKRRPDVVFAIRDASLPTRYPTPALGSDGFCNPIRRKRVGAASASRRSQSWGAVAP
jgi:hypothetical protein